MTFERGAALVGVLAVAGLVGYGSYRVRMSLERKPSPEAVLAEAPDPVRPGTETTRFPAVRAPRNLFRPLQLEAPRSKEQAAPPTTSPPPQAGGGWYPPYTMPYIPPAYVGGFTPASGLPGAGAGGQPGEPSKTEPKPEPPQPPKPDAASIAVTAMSTGASGVRVLVEDLTTHRSQWVSAGGAAFGYTLERATAKGGLFSKGGRYYALGLGDGKSGKPVPSASRPAAPPAEGAPKTGASAVPPAPSAPPAAATP